MQESSVTRPQPHWMRMAVTTSPSRLRVTLGLAQAPGDREGSAELARRCSKAGLTAASAGALASTGAKTDSRGREAAGASGTNRSDMAWGMRGHGLLALAFRNTLTRRLISLVGSSLGMGTVAPKPATFLICELATPCSMSLRRTAVARSADISQSPYSGRMGALPLSVWPSSSMEKVVKREISQARVEKTQSP